MMAITQKLLEFSGARWGFASGLLTKNLCAFGRQGLSRTPCDWPTLKGTAMALNAFFLGTDKSERWTIEEFKAYAKPAFLDGHGWTYLTVERNWQGDGNTRWFDEILFNEKLGHCRGTGVVELINDEWKIAHYALTMLVPNSIAVDVGEQTRKAEKLLSEKGE